MPLLKELDDTAIRDVMWNINSVKEPHKRKELVLEILLKDLAVYKMSLQ